MITCLDGDDTGAELLVTIELAADNEPHTAPAVLGTTAAPELANDAMGDNVLTGILLPPGIAARKLPLGTGAKKLAAAAAAGAIFCTAPALECLTKATRLLLAAAALFGLAAAAPCTPPPLVRDAKFGTATKPSFELVTIYRTGCVWVFIGLLAGSPGFQLPAGLGPTVRTLSSDFPAVRFAMCALDTTMAWPLFAFVKLATAPADDAATGSCSC